MYGSIDLNRIGFSPLFKCFCNLLMAILLYQEQYELEIIPCSSLLGIRNFFIIVSNLFE